MVVVSDPINKDLNIRIYVRKRTQMYETERKMIYL